MLQGKHNHIIRPSIILTAAFYLLLSASGPCAKAEDRSVEKKPSHGKSGSWEFVPESAQNNLDQTSTAGGDIDGDGFADIVIGEPKFNDGEGRVLFFYGGKDGLAVNPSTIFAGQKGMELGSKVRFLGDINGDQLTDFLIVSKKAESGGSRVMIYFGDRGRHFREYEWKSPLTPKPVGDLNGDGFDDLAERREKEGAVVLFKGSPNGPSIVPDWRVRGEQEGSSFSHEITSAGDVNGDGFGDLLVAAPRFNGRYEAGGKAYLFLGSKNGVPEKWAWAAEYDLAAEEGVDDLHEQLFSRTISSAGDINGDGFSDVLVGAPFAERQDRNEGIVFLYLGSKKGLNANPAWIGESNHEHTLFGESLSSARDVNGDGFDDILIGMPQATDGQQAEGAVAVYHGSAKGISKLPDGLIEGDHTHETLGAMVRAAGDINGDGFADVMIVGPGLEHVGSTGVLKYGRVLVFYGSPQGLAFNHHWDLDKPILTQLQQRLTRYQAVFGSVVYWGPLTLLLAIVVCLSATMKVYDRKRINALLAENRKLVSAEERTRIARDIHDHLGADLTFIALNAKKAANLTQVAPSNRNIKEILDCADQALTKMDELIWVTNPNEDKLESMLLQIADLVSTLTQNAGIACRVQVPDDVPEKFISAKFRHEVFSAIKELTTNITKHSNASLVVLECSIQNGSIKVSISDDGCGIAQADSRKGERWRGNGISNIIGRIKDIGGTVVFSSGGKWSTTVQLELPN